MDNLELIDIDLFKNSFYKALLPLNSINDFLASFETHEQDIAAKTLIALFDTAVTKILLLNLNSITDKEEFLRLAQDNYSSPEIMKYIVTKLPDGKELITQILDKTLLSAKKAIL